MSGCCCIGPLAESDADHTIVIRTKHDAVLWRFYPNGHIFREPTSGKPAQEWTDLESVLYVNRKIRDCITQPSMFPNGMGFLRWRDIVFKGKTPKPEAPKYAPCKEVDDVVEWAVDYAQRLHFMQNPQQWPTSSITDLD